MLRSQVRTPLDDLIIEIRPQCGKCRKEFMLDLRSYLPGKLHACIACGNVIQFNEAVAQTVQRLTKELRQTIQEAFEDIQRL